MQFCYFRAQQIDATSAQPSVLLPFYTGKNKISEKT